MDAIEVDGLEKRYGEVQALDGVTFSVAAGEVVGLIGMFAPAMEYMIDAAQRSVLFWDVMRQRGNQYREHMAETAPHVLDYKVELVVDGNITRGTLVALAALVTRDGMIGTALV